MKKYMKSLVLMAVAAFFLASVSAQAYTVTYQDYIPANANTNDQSGLTSVYGTNALVKPSGSSLINYEGVNALYYGGTVYFTETFDAGTQAADSQVTVGGGGKVTFHSTGGGFTTILAPTLQLYTTGGAGVQKGTEGWAAAPAGDTTNFAYLPDHYGPTPTAMKVNYGPEFNKGQYINYLGLYAGSIDTYNSLNFYKADANGIDVPMFTITGTQLLAIYRGTSGNQTASASNVYLNIAFNATERFSSFEYWTSGVAFESDNLTAGLHVPEPATMLLLGLGLVGLAGVRRRFKK